MTNLPSIRVTILDSHQQEGFMVIWLTRQQWHRAMSKQVDDHIFFRFPIENSYWNTAKKKLAFRHFRQRRTTTISRPRRNNAKHQTSRVWRRRWALIQEFLSRFIPVWRAKARFLHIATRTSTTSQRSLAYLGKTPKVFHSTTPYLISVLYKTSNPAQYPYRKPKRRSTGRSSLNEKRRQLTHYKRLGSYTINSYTYHWLSLPDISHITGSHSGHILVAAYSITVLSYLAPHQNVLPVTYLGGQISFPQHHLRNPRHCRAHLKGSIFTSTHQQPHCCCPTSCHVLPDHIPEKP